MFPSVRAWSHERAASRWITGRVAGQTATCSTAASLSKEAERHPRTRSPLDMATSCTDGPREARELRANHGQTYLRGLARHVCPTRVAGREQKLRNDDRAFRPWRRMATPQYDKYILWRFRAATSAHVSHVPVGFTPLPRRPVRRPLLSRDPPGSRTLFSERSALPIAGTTTSSTMSAAKCAVTAATSLRYQYSQPKAAPDRGGLSTGP